VEKKVEEKEEKEEDEDKRTKIYIDAMKYIK